MLCVSLYSGTSYSVYCVSYTFIILFPFIIHVVVCVCAEISGIFCAVKVLFGL